MVNEIILGKYRESLRKMLYPLLVVAVVVMTGTLGYTLLEGWPVFDSFYMTIITLSTIGYGEVHQMDSTGRAFTVFLIFIGVGTAAYAIKTATKLMLEGELKDIFGRKKLETTIKNLKGHYIVCGFGRMGRLICKELARKPVPFVVIERDAPAISEADREKYLIIEGDADRDEVLIEAGIKEAAGLITIVSSDADNLYIVLSARGLNPDLYIVARAGNEGSEQKLLRAGASKVISPYLIGADRMAQAMLRPAVVDFIEFATQSENLELQMEEVTLKKGSSLSGLAINQCGIRQDLGIIIVAIKRADRSMEFNPNPTSILNEGDCLIALGRPKQLKALEEITLGV